MGILSKKTYGLLVAALCAAMLSAQTVSIDAKIDTAAIWIGDQTNLTFEIAQPADSTVILPIWTDRLIDGIEIVEQNPLDTVSLTADRILVSKKLVITSFEDSLYYVPAQPFVCGKDTVYSNAFTLNVIQPFVIDTANHAITDIKGTYAPPIYWWGIIRIVLLVLVIAGLAVLGYFLYKKYHRTKGEQEEAPAVIQRPPYEIAIEALDKIKAEKIWQQHGRQKNYHTELTDVVRNYIDGTFGISSMEMTSMEILMTLKPEMTNKKSEYEALKQILTLADLVKFAKWTAMPDENEQSLNNAYLFVRGTMPEENKLPEESKEA